MLVRAMTIFMLWLGAAVAQTSGPASGPDGAQMMKTLPEQAMKKLRAAPDRFLADAAGLIYGFGKDGGIDAAGIETFIAVERARVRASGMQRYLAADLDNDGIVTRDEVAVLVTAAAAAKRGSLQLGFDTADANKDAALGLDELGRYAQGLAKAKLSDTDAAGLRGLMVFDLNRDGRVVMDEVTAGVTALIALAHAAAATGAQKHGAPNPGAPNPGAPDAALPHVPGDA